MVVTGMNGRFMENFPRGTIREDVPGGTMEISNNRVSGMTDRFPFSHFGS